MESNLTDLVMLSVSLNVLTLLAIAISHTLLRRRLKGIEDKMIRALPPWALMWPG